MELVFKVEYSEIKSAAKKLSLTWSKHSRSFLVIYYAISYSIRAARDCLL